MASTGASWRLVGLSGVQQMGRCLHSEKRGLIGPAAPRCQANDLLRGIRGGHLSGEYARRFFGCKQDWHLSAKNPDHVSKVHRSSIPAFSFLQLGGSHAPSLSPACINPWAQASVCAALVSRAYASSECKLADSSPSAQSGARKGSSGGPETEASAVEREGPSKRYGGGFGTLERLTSPRSTLFNSATGKQELKAKAVSEASTSQASSATLEEARSVSLLELLSFAGDQKCRIGAILLALLLSSGAQLLLPMAMGQVIDAVTHTPLQRQTQQQQQQEQPQQPLEREPQQKARHTGAKVSPSEKVPTVESASAAAADCLRAEPPASVNQRQEEGLLSEGASNYLELLQALSEKIKTPVASVGLCVALAALGAATTFMRLYLLESTIERLACRLRSKLFRQLLNQPPEAWQHQQLGALVKHLSQDAFTASRVLTDVSFGLRCLITSVVGLGLCWTIAPVSFLLSLLLPVSAAAFVLRLSARHVSSVQQQHSRALQGALQRATGALGARKQLRSLNAEAYELKAFDSALSGVYAAARKSAATVGCRYAFVFAAGSGLIVHLAYCAAGLVAQGVLTGGQVASLALYSAIVGSSLQGCATAWSDTNRAVAASADMLKQLLRSSPQPLSAPLGYEAELRRYAEALRQQEVNSAAGISVSQGGGPSVEFKDVWFSYPGREGQWALKGVSFTIPPGAKVAILGPSGSGKSSLGALLLRLYEPQRGGIFLGGLPVRAFDQRFIRSMVLPVIQDSPLVGCDSLQENILYAQKAHQEIIGEAAANTSFRLLASACDAATVSSFIASLPAGLQTPLGEKGAVLSGGQRQRVSLAMALCRLEHSRISSGHARPEGMSGAKGPLEEVLPRVPTVLLLDEATSSLDAATEHQVLLNLQKLLHGETCLIISHRPATLEISDHIAVSASAAPGAAALALSEEAKALRFQPKAKAMKQLSVGANLATECTPHSSYSLQVMDAGQILQFGRKEDVLSRPCPPLQWKGAEEGPQVGQR
ncbi:hypothetical protein Efla_004008 [Eimeria flavescens]